MRVVLDAVGHSLEPGHRIRLAVSPTYWPFAWPSPEIVTLGVATGATAASSSRCGRPRTATPTCRPSPSPSMQRRSMPRTTPSRSRRIVRELDSGTWRVELEGSEWTVLPGAFGHGERGYETYSIVEGDPLSARVDRAYRHELQRGDWRIAADTRTSLAATATEFVITTELEVFEGVRLVHRLARTCSVPRDGA